jgi:hypothetical protein
LPLLEELAVLGDAQTTLLLLRQCASYCRMVYSTRVTPPMGLAPALQSFDTAVRGCLEAGCSGPLTPEAWMQASLSTRSGGLGLRSVARHSVAGYAASLLATAPLCKEIDGNYDADQGAALHQVNLALPPADHFPVPAPHPPRQQELSRALDRVVIAQLATTSSTPNSGTAAKPGRPRATRAGPAGAARGCFSCSLAATAPVLFSKGGEVKAAQARESSPSAASEQQRLCRADRASSSSISSGRLRRVAGMASHNSSRSPASQRAQRR